MSRGCVGVAYGGVYVSVAILRLWAVESVRPMLTDVVGVCICLIGMVVIMSGSRAT